jgi:tight adherence protein C
MAILISLSLFLLLMTAISVYGFRKYARPARFYDQLGGTAVSTETRLISPEDPAEANAGLGAWTVKIIQQIGEKVPISPADVSIAQRYLIAAGFRGEAAVPVYFGIKVILCAVLLFLALTFGGNLTSKTILRVVFLVAAGCAGYFGPNMILERMVSKRQERIRMALPDALDLLVVCVEAGLGLDQAIQSVSRELAMAHKDICEEFGLVTLEMRAGKRRSEALKNLSDRTGESELRQLVAILVQTDRFGTSMADSLRSHSDFMRVRRAQQAEERANKVGVKLVFPIFFFILPSMIVVSAGPALLQVFKVLRPLMRGIAQH